MSGSRSEISVYMWLYDVVGKVTKPQKTLPNVHNVFSDFTVLAADSIAKIGLEIGQQYKRSHKRNRSSDSTTEKDWKKTFN